MVRQLSAIVIVTMGLFLLGFFQPQLLIKNWKFNFRKRGGFFGSFIFGFGFAMGWSPCIGAILAPIITLIALEPSRGTTLITAYSIGFSFPFMCVSFFIGSTRWFMKYAASLMKWGGAIMVLMGVLLFFDRLHQLNVWLEAVMPHWEWNFTL